MKYGRGWIILLIMALLAPLGIIAAGGAWGEWDLDGVKDRAGFAPEGMREAARGVAKSPLGDYTVPGMEGDSFREGTGTIISALLGAGITALAAYAIARIARHGDIS